MRKSSWLSKKFNALYSLLDIPDAYASLSQDRKGKRRHHYFLIILLLRPQWLTAGRRFALGLHPCDPSWATSVAAVFTGRSETNIMAKQRIVNTKFWDDSYVASLDPTEKLVFLYLLTNPLTNISGVYELPLKRAAFDIGLDSSLIESVLRKFEADGKMFFKNGWIGIVNFIKHQTLNPKVKQGILIELKKAPKEIVDNLNVDYHKLLIAYDSLSHSNFNSNPNPNVTVCERSFKMREIEKRKKELARQWKMF